MESAKLTQIFQTHKDNSQKSRKLPGFFKKSTKTRVFSSNQSSTLRTSKVPFSPLHLGLGTSPQCRGRALRACLGEHESATCHGLQAGATSNSCQNLSLGFIGFFLSFASCFIMFIPKLLQKLRRLHHRELCLPKRQLPPQSVWMEPSCRRSFSIFWAPLWRLSRKTTGIS